MLYDKEFLLQLDKEKNKTIYARITALQFDESPIERIEGRVTQGSINIDGSSAVRRSCSLTLIAQNINYNDYYWGLNTKFKLEIGVKNTINSSYPDIIWFKQGLYLITSFNTSHSTNSYTIAISGKDKMCLLNGEVGGSLESSIDFGTIEEQNNQKIWVKRKLPIQEIIRNAVHTYAGEPYHNIIINDLDTYGLELLEYRYDTPMYLYGPPDTTHGGSAQIYDNVILENNTILCSVDGQVKSLAGLTAEDLDPLVETLTQSNQGKDIYFIETDEENKEVVKGPYKVVKVEYGQTAGYRTTDLVYAGDLIANIGESLTSILDKIKNMLVEFEYFYDLDGRFVFQKKRSFINTLWSPTANIEDVNKQIESIDNNLNNIYKFSGGELIAAFNNNPNLLELRNDFSIWGTRQSVNGTEIPVHMRYAIDKKPVQYTTIVVSEEEITPYNEKYGTNLKAQTSITYSIEEWDWREIIYQMALDYYRFNHLDDFELKVAKVNSNYETGYPTGRTGYEQYYIDLKGFWRQLYNPNITEDDEDYNNYYHDGEHIHWAKAVYEQPDTLNFWFDFLDSEGELQQFNVKNIGSRPKALNDNNIKAIYFRETPSIIFVDKQKDAAHLTGYRTVQAPNIETMFSISAQGKSAKDQLDELLYKHSYCIESATITTIPVYYLEPNTRIYLYDNSVGLNGDYIVNKISIPLSYNGTMSITATKAVDNII